MKLKINKACDLNSISVLPPHTRRSSSMAHPQLQPSQQSFSQGFSSQQTGMFSQISQNSLDEVLTENQRFGSQEKDNSLKKVACLAFNSSCSREDSQLPISRSSTGLAHRWSSATLPARKCQLNDELEYRITTMETSLSKIGMVLDSVQADVMQVNKGTKELSLEVESVHQKLIGHADSLHQLNRGHEEIRANLELGFKSISHPQPQDKLEQILSEICTLEQRINTNVHKQNSELFKSLSGDLQAITCSIRTLNQINMPPAVLPPKVTGADSSSQKPLLTTENETRGVSKEVPLAPKIEMGRWTTVKAQRVNSTIRSGCSTGNVKQRTGFSMKDRDQKGVIELDVESDEDHSCFIVEEKSNAYCNSDDEEAARILKLARRRKRKQNSFMRTYQKK